MTQYIDKSAVVAELERLISNGQTKLKESEERKDYESYVALAERIATCINVLSFLDTLDVKEVDLNREIEKEIETRWRGEYLFTTKFKESAKHFFELGLKVKCNIQDVEKVSENSDTLEEKLGNQMRSK